MTLTVLVEKAGPGQFRAVTSQPIALAVEAESAANAVRRLKEAMENKLAECEVVELNIQSSQRDHPWMKYAGIWKEQRRTVKLSLAWLRLFSLDISHLEGTPH